MNRGMVGPQEGSTPAAGARAGRGCALAIVLAAALLGAPATAGADTSSCTYLTFPIRVVVLNITDTGFNDPQGVAVDGNKIRQYNDGLLIDCGAATIHNTDLVVISDASPSDSAGVSAVILPYTHEFAPGQLPEPGSSDEIEFAVNLHGGSDQLTIDKDIDGTHPQAANMRMGRSGDDRLVNMNANEVDGVDSDVSLEGVELVTASAASPVNVRATGGRGTGKAPLDLRTELVGDDGKDHLAGGSRADEIVGFEGSDRLFGGRGGDTIKGFSGPDLLRGQNGRDRLFGGRGRDRLNGGRRRDRCADSRRGTHFISCERLVFEVLFP